MSERKDERSMLLSGSNPQIAKDFGDVPTFVVRVCKPRLFR